MTFLVSFFKNQEFTNLVLGWERIFKKKENSPKNLNNFSSWQHSSLNMYTTFQSCIWWIFTVSQFPLHSTQNYLYLLVYTHRHTHIGNPSWYSLPLIHRSLILLISLSTWIQWKFFRVVAQNFPTNNCRSISSILTFKMFCF